MNMINKSDRIFIAGHKGMVGSSICRALNKKGYQQLLMANREELDLTNQFCVNNWIKENKPTIVVIAAAKVGGILANSLYTADFILENMKIQSNLIEASWQNKVKRLLFLGSSCIYPKFAKQPITEESLLTGPLEVTNQSYAIAKITGIKLCEALRKQYDFDAISLMPTNLYGPGDNYKSNQSHVIPALIRKFWEAKSQGREEVICWGSGNPLREFLHVDDLGEACVFALEKWDLKKENSPEDSLGNKLSYLNVGTGEDHSIKFIANKISKYLNYQGSIKWDLDKPDGTPKKQLDISRLRDLGWESKININDGLKATIENFKSDYAKNIVRI